MRFFKLTGFLFLFVSFFGEAFSYCEDIEFDNEVSCGKKVFVARNSDDLESYRQNYGLELGQYKHLRVAFDVESSEDIQIVSPCRIFVDADVDMDSDEGVFCINGNKGVSTGHNFMARFPVEHGSFEIISDEGRVKISGNAVFSGEKYPRVNIQAKDFRLTRNSSLEVMNGDLNITPECHPSERETAHQ